MFKFSTTSKKTVDQNPKQQQQRNEITGLKLMVNSFQKLSKSGLSKLVKKLSEFVFFKKKKKQRDSQPVKFREFYKIKGSATTPTLLFED